MEPTVPEAPAIPFAVSLNDSVKIIIKRKSNYQNLYYIQQINRDGDPLKSTFIDSIVETLPFPLTLVY